MSYSSAEVKSGALVIAALVGLFGMTVVVGNVMRGETKTWQVQFGYVSGLEKNAPVYFAGTEVGKVDEIQVLHGEERPVLLTLSIDKEIQLRGDSQAFVDTLGMMGEKFVELTPGTKAASMINQDTVIQGHDPIPMHEMIEKMNVLADRMEELTTSINPLMARVNGIVAENEEEIHKIIANLEQTSANVRDMTHDLKFRPWRLVRKNS